MNSNKLCASYGHQWQRNPHQTATLPHGYVFEECAWCGDTRTVLEY